MAESVGSRGWHTANWGLWGWLETAAKLVGVVFGVVAFFQAMPGGSFILSGHPHLASVILLGLLTFVAVVVIPIRIQQREIISIAFAIANALGHLAVLFAILWKPTETTLPLLFGVAYVIGNLVKVRFLSITGYTENGASSGMMHTFTWSMVAFYAAYSILLLI